MKNFEEFITESIFKKDPISKIEELKTELELRKMDQNIGYKKTTYIGLMNELISLFNKIKDKNINIDYKNLFDFIWGAKNFMRPASIIDQFTIYKVLKKINKYCEEFGYEKIDYDTEEKDIINIK